KKAERTARAAAREFRALADEIERRLPSPKEEPAARGAKATTARPPRSTTPRSGRTSAPASRPSASAKPRTRRTPAPSPEPTAPSREPTAPSPEPTAPAQPPAEASIADGDAPPPQFVTLASLKLPTALTPQPCTAA